MKSIDSKILKNKIEDAVERDYTLSVDNASAEQLYKALAVVVRGLLADMARKHTARTYGEDKKQVCYMCMEFLIGRSLKNNLCNLGIEDAARKAMDEIGVPLETLYEQEPDAGLGNGGLGRLAACYLDALARCGYGAVGYSILYEYGIFKQTIIDGWQSEQADNWLPGGSVWLEQRASQSIEVNFGGEIKEDWYGSFHHVYQTNCDTVIAVPYDLYISGYDSKAVSVLRLWKAQSPGIDMESFVRGDYSAAMTKNNTAELISKVLYPNDEHIEGKILRLRQQYFLCCASVSDLVHRHLEQYGTLDNLPEEVAIHINDTHPTLAIPELMRIMLDECGFSWEHAYDIACRTFSYTNHTILSEALECWNVEMFSAVLPRIYQIVVELDRRLVERLEARYPGDVGKITWMRIISDNYVRMANLCVSVSHAVNGVSQLHTDIIKDSLFADYYNFTPEKFLNVTNGIAYRRWLLQSNPELTALLSETIGDGFKYDAAKLKDFERYADDAGILARLAEIKHNNKVRLAEYIKNTEGLDIDCDSIFDVQVKRLHEYKRQHLNALHIIRQYLDVKAGKKIVPRTYIFGAKAASGYYLAKQIIRLIWAVAQLCESDPDVRNYIRVVFLQDYRVTVSELLMPASEISEQISLAGKEASGTGNMKFMLNGAVTLGTLDGANVEIKQAVGADNFVQFGMTKQEVLQRQADGYSPKEIYDTNKRVSEVLDFIDAGFSGKSFPDIINNLLGADPYMVLADFDSYCAAQDEVERIYSDPRRFGRMSLMNIANSGVFSADRSVTEYAEKIWNLKPID